MGEYDDLIAAAKPKGGGEYDDLIAHAATLDTQAPPAPTKRSFIGEAIHRAGEAIGPTLDIFRNATMPESASDAWARVKQNAPVLLQGPKDLGHALYEANTFGNKALLHPVDTFGDGKGSAVGNELLRGAYSNVPLLNLINERAFGVPEASPEDAAKAPGARQFGALAGAAVVSELGAAGAERAGATLDRVATAADERGIARATEKLGEDAAKAKRLGVTRSTPVERLVRNDKAIRAAAGNDSKLAPELARVRSSAMAELDDIYKTSGGQATGLQAASDAVSNMDKRIAELNAGNAADRKVAKSLQGIRDEFNLSFGASGNFDVKKLRSEQTAYQRSGYGKAIPGTHGYEEAAASIEANREASKAVGDAVSVHVTGMPYAQARESAALNPGGPADRLLSANDQLTAVGRIEAAMQDRANLPPEPSSIAQRMLAFAKHARRSLTGATVAPALEAGAKALDAADSGFVVPAARAAAQGARDSRHLPGIIAARDKSREEDRRRAEALGGR
jgi:hypothetical protein